MAAPQHFDVSSLIDRTAPGNPSSACSKLLLAMPPELRGDMSEFLFYDLAPSNLRAFSVHAQLTSDSLSTALDRWHTFALRSEVERWHRSLKWAIDPINAKRLAQIGPILDPGDHMYRHGIRRHAVYSALLMTTLSPNRFRRFQFLKVQLFLAQVLCLDDLGLGVAEYERYTGAPGFMDRHASPVMASLFVRLVSRRLGYALDQLPVELEPEEFANNLPRSISGPHSDYYEHFRIFIEKAYAGRIRHVLRSRTGFARSATVTERWSKEDFTFGELSAELQSAHGLTKYARRTPFDAAEKKQFDLTDDDPDEAQTDDSYSLVVAGEDESETKQIATLTRAAVRHASRANQRFWWRYPDLIREELEPLFIAERRRFLERWQAGVRNRETLDDLEVFARLDTMLATSSELDRDLRVYDSVEAVSGEFGIVPGAAAAPPKWVIKAPLPHRQNDTRVRHGVDRERTEYVTLPDICGLSRFVFELTALQRPQASGGRVFTREPRWYQRKIKALIQRLGLPSRVTHTRISSYLFERVYRKANGDLVAAILVTGRYVPLARAKLHYACRPLERLQQLYLDTIFEEATQLQLEPIVGFKAEPSNLFVSNDPCPLTETVASRVLRLQQLIQRYSRRRAWNRECARRFHNVLTLYVVWWFGYATGIRGIRSPYLPADAYDAETGVATFIDKDRGAGTHARMNWLPNVSAIDQPNGWSSSLVEQMQLYDKYVAENYPEVKLHCFFIDDAGDPVEVCPSSQRLLLDQPWMRIKDDEPFFDYRINIHRRYMLNQLAESCSPQLVDAWAGHWNIGEAPWQPTSSYYPDIARQELARPLIRVLDKLGFYRINPAAVRIRRAS